MSSRVLKKIHLRGDVGFILLPEDCIIIIFKFLNNETLWEDIPLTNKYLNKLLSSSISIIGRDCLSCKDFYEYEIKRINEDKKKEKEVYRSRYKLAISSGLKKIYSHTEEKEIFCCIQCRDKCKRCKAWMEHSTCRGGCCEICNSRICSDCFRLCQLFDHDGIHCLDCLIWREEGYVCKECNEKN